MNKNISTYLVKNKLPMLQGTKKVIAKHNFCNNNMLIKIKGKDAGTFKN